MRDKIIEIKVSMKDRLYELYAYEGEYRNLMTLLADKLCLEDFGECKGIGRCGTCHVYVLDPAGSNMDREGNENTTLHKLGTANENSRLACQILIDNHVHGIHVQLGF